MRVIGAITIRFGNSAEPSVNGRARACAARVVKVVLLPCDRTVYDNDTFSELKCDCDGCYSWPGGAG